MPRPGFEQRKMDEEERRRARAHRKLVWERRVRRWPVALGLLVLLAILLVVLKLVGLAAG